MGRRRPKVSKGEAAVVAHLKRRGLAIVHDTAGFFVERPLLRPDVVVPELRLVFEYDGASHWEQFATKWKKYARGGPNSNDLYKDAACVQHKIHLARIPFTVKEKDIPVVVDQAIEYARSHPKGPFLSACGTDYYTRPHALPCRREEVIDLTLD